MYRFYWYMPEIKRYGGVMKKISVLVSVLFVIVGLLGCKSGPQAYVAPPVSPEKYKTVYIDLAYDPILLITNDEKIRVIEDLQSRLHGMGFGMATTQDRADMILTITIDELVLVRRNDRLVARSTFGLVKDAASMAYTASFVDSRTLDEITSKKGTMKTTKYFLSKEKIRARFFSEMEEEILEFVSESKTF
jgi:hypothetical protein